MHDERVLVVGGSGFLGRSLQDRALEGGFADRLVFAFRSRPDRVRREVARMHLDLEDLASASAAGAFSRAIWVAGNGDHALAHRDPRRDLELGPGALLAFLAAFKGSLVYLSSQAVSYGLTGCVDEERVHVPTMPYGIAKHAAEAYARWAVATGALERLWIYRLMYAFGPFETERRLISRCARATRDDKAVEIVGGGRSLVNPLPAWFVSQALWEASRELERRPCGTAETVNLNHEECWTVADVVTHLAQLAPFRYEIFASGEEWPVVFFGDPRRLRAYLARWGLELPDVRSELRRHFIGQQETA